MRPSLSPISLASCTLSLRSEHMAVTVQKSRPSPSAYETAARMLRCDVPAIMAVAEVEAGPAGAFLPSGEPVILFEPHIFSRLTNRRYDATHPKLSYPEWRHGPGVYGKPSEQHAKLQAAAALDRAAALAACSWGLFQIMGFNFKRAGHPSLQSLVTAAYGDVDSHLRMFVNFILSSSALSEALREHDWPEFKRLYNGSGTNDYAARMARAYKRLTKKK